MTEQPEKTPIVHSNVTEFLQVALQPTDKRRAWKIGDRYVTAVSEMRARLAVSMLEHPTIEKVGKPQLHELWLKEIRKLNEANKGDDDGTENTAD